MIEEILFTPEEIQHITTEAAKHSRFVYPPEAIPIYSFTAKNPTDIVRISHIHKLILPIGTIWTGLEHIRKRHDFYSSIRDWNNPNIPNPGRFSPKTIGVMDYVTIADTVFDPTKRVTSGKHNGKESYDGEYRDHENVTMQYRLVLYENTKIIHNLFPLERTHNVPLPKNFKWKRGSPGLVEPENEGTIELVIPYYNDKKILAYLISLVQDPKLQTEVCRIIKCNPIGEPIGYIIVGSRQLVGLFDAAEPRTYMGYKFAKLLLIEQAMMDYDALPTKT